MPWLLPNTSLLPPCPFLAPTYEPALQIISRPVTITLRQEELSLTSVCPAPVLSLVSGSAAPPPASDW